MAKAPRTKGRRGCITNRVWVIFAAAAVLLFLVYSLAAQTADQRTPQLSAYSDDWNDLSELREDLEADGYEIGNILSSPALLDTIEDPSSTCVVVMGVERPYSNTEAWALYDFFLRGGKLIIADDFGFMDSLAHEAGGYFMINPTGGRLWDQSYQRNPAFVKVSMNEPDMFAGTLLLNKPSAFHVEGDGEILARSSGTSWIDLDNDNQHDPNEVYGNHIIIRMMRSESYTDGKEGGRAVFISDPSMFINDMYGRLDNRNFTMALMHSIMGPEAGERPGEGYTVLFDESRHVKEDLGSTAENAFFDGLVRSTTDRNFRILTGVIAILSMVVLMVAAENPGTLRHRQDLSLAKYHHLHSPEVVISDILRVRVLLRERVRIAYGMEREEFGALKPEELEELIQNEALADFALERGREPTPGELEALLLEIQRWG